MAAPPPRDRRAPDRHTGHLDRFERRRRRAERARELREDDDRRSVREIQDILSRELSHEAGQPVTVSRSTIYEWLADPDNEASRARKASYAKRGCAAHAGRGRRL